MFFYGVSGSLSGSSYGLLAEPMIEPPMRESSGSATNTPVKKEGLYLAGLGVLGTEKAVFTGARILSRPHRSSRYSPEKFSTAQPRKSLKNAPAFSMEYQEVFQGVPTKAPANRPASRADE